MNVPAEVRLVGELQRRKWGSHLVVFALMMTVMALGVIVGFSFLLDNPGGIAMLYLATGAPTIVIVMLALVTVPMQNATARIAGYMDFIKTLPIRRRSFLISEVLLWSMITVPAITISLLVSNLLFDIAFDLSWSIIPAYFLLVGSCIGVGYGYSFVLPPEPSMALSQFVAFTALMFSPINFPIERLPDWLAAIHRVLPFYYMAEVMRAALASSTFSVDWVAYAVLGAWAVVGFVAAARALERA